MQPIPSLLLLTIGALGCLNAWRLYRRTIDFARRAQTASGTVIGHERRSDGEGGTSWAPVVRFDPPGGRSVIFTDRISAGRNNPLVGEVVAVKFDPDRPGHARLERTHASQIDAAVFGIVGAAFLLSGLLSLSNDATERAIDLGARDYFHARWACPLASISVAEDPVAREAALRRITRAHKAWIGRIAITPADPASDPTAVVRTDPGTRTRKERLELNPWYGGSIDVQQLILFSVNGCGKDLLVACEHPRIRGGEGREVEREEVACLSVPPE